ncbi:MAG: hypothetical protein CMP80_00845 [Formosa sp.]|nr:hypothetical protein [Formosa sp.]|tara:strand:+ start:5307 stop:5819 length:513 start_codon:yes stop_codon:yes gene_type:complete
MSKEIVNRVAKSKLITIDLEDYYPTGNRIQLDIKGWLFQDLVLKEEGFRESLKTHNWKQYKDSHVALFCSTNAIIPTWAYMLIQTYLNETAKTVTIGTIETIETFLYTKIIDGLDLNYCNEKPVIIKGCSEKKVPEIAYVLLINKLQPIVKSIMYGEACSSVPLYKKKKN